MSGDRKEGADPDATRPPADRADTVRGGDAGTPPVSLAASVGASRDRYATDRLLGEGGMGTVVLCEDRLIGRRVAMKLIRVEEGQVAQEAETRFLREARVQGQLEHPSIVPVYDLGRDEDGAVYFTMKRVQGVTLREVVDGLRADDPATTDRYSLRRLLGAFTSVCLAIDLAHRRGVLHRDLKPANVMLGDFGEVYVLDWGVAGLVNEERPAHPPIDLTASLAGSLTQQDAILGTPGYMSPEQLRGGTLGPTTDVYALGAVLFELLTGERLHTEQNPARLLVAMMSPDAARCAKRFPELPIAPELEAICVRATAWAPQDRFPSTRALSEAIEAYLDGERDSELRTRLARQHADAARRATETAGELPIAERRQALRDVGRALALEPDNADAMRAMLHLLSAPPRELPPEVLDKLERDRVTTRRTGGVLGSRGFAAAFLFVPIVLWAGVRSWPIALGYWGFSALVVLVSYLLGRRKAPTVRHGHLLLALAAVGFTIQSAMFGPLLHVPTVIAISTFGFSLYLARERRWMATLAGAIAMLLPLGLQLLGVLPASYTFEDNRLVIHPAMFDFPKVPTLVFLSVANLATLIVANVIAGRSRDALAAAEERLQTHSWQLSQLVPTAPARKSFPPV